MAPTLLALALWRKVGAEQGRCCSSFLGPSLALASWELAAPLPLLTLQVTLLAFSPSTLTPPGASPPPPPALGLRALI